MKWSTILYAIIKHTHWMSRRRERRAAEWKENHTHTNSRYIWKRTLKLYGLHTHYRIKFKLNTMKTTIRHNNQAKKNFFDLIWFWNGHFLLRRFCSLDLIPHQSDWLTEQVPFGDKIYFKLNDTSSTLNVFIALFSISISCINFYCDECEWTLRLDTTDRWKIWRVSEVVWAENCWFFHLTVLEWFERTRQHSWAVNTKFR